MQVEVSKRKNRNIGRLAFWLGAVLLVIAMFRSISVTEPDETSSFDVVDDRVGVRTIKVKAVDVHPANPNPLENDRGDFELTAGETFSVAMQDIPTERPLVLNLLLPAALPSADALSARIIAMDGSQELKLSDAVVAADRGELRLALERVHEFAQARAKAAWAEVPQPGSPGRRPEQRIPLQAREPESQARHGPPQGIDQPQRRRAVGARCFHRRLGVNPCGPGELRVYAPKPAEFNSIDSGPSKVFSQLGWRWRRRRRRWRWPATHLTREIRRNKLVCELVAS